MLVCIDRKQWILLCAAELGLQVPPHPESDCRGEEEADESAVPERCPSGHAQARQVLHTNTNSRQQRISLWQYLLREGFRSLR